ncbi:hypothetical protein PtB15_9B626 [Puccinia triticina]|nr:hypothetical protein PtB15_9B626 [Puccinia triticina]
MGQTWHSHLPPLKAAKKSGHSYAMSRAGSSNYPTQLTRILASINPYRPLNRQTETTDPILDQQQSPDDLTKTRLINTGHVSPSSAYNHLLKPNLHHISLQQFSQLPEPSLANLSEIENLIKSSSCSSIGRERISTLILKKDYVRKLEPVRIEAEDLESLKDLHTLCMLLQSILMLNDAAIYEYCLQDDIVLIAASILDYDPEFGNQKASYHADLSDPTRFKEVVPIRDEQIKAKIHLTYRLQYFKDIILARIMDDSTFSIINSMLFFNQVEIVQYLHSSDHFMRELFGIFDMGATDPLPAGSSSPIIGPPLPPSMVSERANSKLDGPALLDRKIDTIMFLQQLCAMAKHLQAPSRISFFRSLAERGILKVIEFGLSKQELIKPVIDSTVVEGESSREIAKTREAREDEAMIKSVVCEVLMTIIDYDPSSVRGYCLKQRQEGTQTLAESLIELLISETDLGLKVQLTDALRTLLDISGTGLGNPSNSLSFADSNGPLKRDEDPDNERFLQFFYDHCVHILASPLLKLPELNPYAPPSERETVSLSPLEAATFNHLCEMICFIIVQHSFRSKYFILSTNLLNKIGSLLTIIGPRSAPALTTKAKPSKDSERNEVSPPAPAQTRKNSYKYLELVGLKILKTCFNKKDQFYDRALIKNSLIDLVVLDIFVAQDGKDNLVSSACLELFENIRLNNPKPILNHLMDKRPDVIRLLAQKFTTFQSLIQRWEQNNDPQNAPGSGPAQSSSSNNTEENAAHNVRNIGSWSRSQTLDAEEENYFNDSDEETEEVGDVMIASTSRTGGGMIGTRGMGQHKRQRSMTGVNPDMIRDLSGDKVGQEAGPPKPEGGVKPLVDYPDEDDEGATAPSSDASPTPVKSSEVEPGLSGELPPTARLGERRRREEDEEDLNGLGGLLGGSGGRESKRGRRSVPMARAGAAQSIPPLLAPQTPAGDSAGLASLKTAPPTANKSLVFGPKKIVFSLASSSLIAAASSASSAPPSAPTMASSSSTATPQPPKSTDKDPADGPSRSSSIAHASAPAAGPPQPSPASSLAAPALASPPLPDPSSSAPSALSSSSPAPTVPSQKRKKTMN